MLMKTDPVTAFRIEQLTVDYDTNDGGPLRDFSLSIRQGEITCLLGPSGCGKTTLLKALGGFVIGRDSGGVLFEGRYLNGPTPNIVMIFQENNLFPWLTVRGNVAFGVKFKRGNGPSDPAIDAMLQTVGLDEAADRYPHQLSGGMRQRTAIARALVSAPQVLLLDEPFSALDVSLRRRMHTLMLDLWEKTGKTMVMVTHNIEEALKVGHRVIVLGDSPARVLIDADTSSDAMNDRYSSEFLQLQQRIEDVIY
ncbi:ABC transporter ATP-binding protein [Pseudomonas extremaustralis]|uniref:ABC transporter ATP-binding protein n=1 Tax=Pseudomonas extremaustralis TaxID=359110 RepID=UPI00240F8713|nr:ABC transporter ATP-binding protein [Pseudomonas extremaustralis]MDG2971196.1 ABC transporter ATP-binding protein [Pseudomonas extremaustralis]